MNDSTYYKLANRLKSDGVNINTIVNGAVRLATVSNTQPFKLKVGQCEYSSSDWQMYEAEVYGDIEGEQTTLNSANLGEESGTLSASRAKVQKAVIDTKYKVGDLLAVVEISNGNEFIILCRLRRL
nr:MAG TPA: Protein of unknown function (DUF2577) [Caudoviricetes sp.]